MKYLLPLALVLMTGRVAAEDTAWVERVLFGDGPLKTDRHCTRWVRSPRLTLHNPSAEQKSVAQELIADLNETLTGTPIFRIQFNDRYTGESDIQVYFDKEKNLPALAEKLGIKYVRGNRGFYWLWWNDRHELTRAVVLIADELRGSDLRSMLLKELVQALGVQYDSPDERDSIFYRDGRRETTATRLANIDRKLLVFYYNRVKPGMKLADVRKELKVWE